MNLIEIAGFLGADPEERFTATGKKVVTLRVAAKVRHNGQDDTIWWRVSVWGDRYDKMLQYMKKGSAVIIHGELSKPETYVSKKDGSTQVSMNMTAEIIKFSPFGKPEGGSDRQAAPKAAPAPQQQQEEQQFASFGAGSDDSGFTGDDLPF